MVESRPTPAYFSILRDCTIRLLSPKARESCPHLLRLVVVWDAEHRRVLSLLTNHLTLGATTVAAIDKERWQIAIFFKLLKQNLKIKTFVGTSANALKIQIWTAVIIEQQLKSSQIIINRGSASGEDTHPTEEKDIIPYGDEVMILISGHVELQVYDKTFKLNHPGDFVHFKSNLPHRLISLFE